MSDPYRQLNANLPQRDAGAAAFASDPGALGAWVDALPLANASVAAVRMCEGLRALNAKVLDGSRRLHALERLRAAAKGLAQGFERQITGSSFPLPAQKIDFGELALSLHGELAAGYRIALAEVCAPAGNAPFLRGGQVALAATRALQHGSAHLATAYLLYRMPPIGAWQALHAVYAFVAALRLDDRGVDGTSARLEYVQALLLALANPYGSTQREQGELAGWTCALAPHCELRHGNGAPHDVVIPDMTDRGPGYLPDEQASGRRDVPVLRLQPMLTFVEEQMAMARSDARVMAFRRSGGTALQVDSGLVRRAFAGWSGRGDRGRARMPDDHPLESVLGLHDLHFVLAGDEDFETFMRNVQGEAISLSDTDRAAPWQHRVSEAWRVRRLQARVIDQSAGGCRIVWEPAAVGEGPRARVGELVGLRAPGGHAQWTIGVIRWLRIDDDGRTDAGIERLAPHVLPVGVRASDRGRVVRGLLLSTAERSREGGHDALLVPTEIDRAVTEVEVFIPAQPESSRPARNIRINGLRLLEAGGIHHHFALVSGVDASADTAGTFATA